MGGVLRKPQRMIMLWQTKHGSVCKKKYSAFSLGTAEHSRAQNGGPTKIFTMVSMVTLKLVIGTLELDCDYK